MIHSVQSSASHFILEILAYFAGARIYWRYARSTSLLSMPTVDRYFLLGFAIFGAFLGSKLLHILEHLPFLLTQPFPSELWLSGKTVLGGFLGGTFTVEIGKKLIGWKASTGDAWVVALAVGLIIGRIGCQLSGLWDLTYGTPTTLPWGWNYGDNILRHPTALYEALLLTILLVFVMRIPKNWSGIRFDTFLGSYCLLRVVLDFLKPPFGDDSGVVPVALYFGLTAIQWAGLLGAIYFSWHLYFIRLPQRKINDPH